MSILVPYVGWAKKLDPTIYTVINPDLPDWSSGWGGYTLRQTFQTSALSNKGLNYCRIMFRSRPSYSFSIAAAYIGIGSGQYGFSVAPTQIKFSGNNNVTITSTKLSDWIPFVIPSTGSIVISIYVSSGDTMRSNGGSGALGWYKNANDAANLSPTGYTSGHPVYAVDLIQASQVAS